MLSDDESFCSGDETCSGVTDSETSVLSEHFLSPVGGGQRAKSSEALVHFCSVAPTMSGATHRLCSPKSAAPLQLPVSGETASKSPQCKRAALTSQQLAGINFGRAQACLPFGTCGLALWSLLIVLWMHHAVPGRQQPHALRYDRSMATRPLVVLLLIGTLLLAVTVFMYSLLWSNRGVRIKVDMNSGTKMTMGAGIMSNSMASVDLEMQSVERRRLPSAAGRASRCKSDSDSDEGFVSCDEGDNVELSSSPGAVSVGGFFVDRHRFPDESGCQDVGALFEEIFRQCSAVNTISKDQTLRLSLGLSFDAATVVNKWREICMWRRKYGMDAKHLFYADMQHLRVTTDVRFPHEDQIYAKAFVVSPCALVSRAGEPVSLWFAGTGSSSASSISMECIEEWSRSVFEYADVWAKSQSQATGRLLGQIQVFDMSGVGFRQLANTALHERLKTALACGSNYVELVSQIYVINSSWAFSKVWNIIKPLISPRTASKVTVATDVPQELVDLLTEESAMMLPEIMEASRQRLKSKVQRPPNHQHNCAQFV